MDSETLTPQTTPPRDQGRKALIAGYIAIWLLMTLLSVAALSYMSSIQKQLHNIVEIHNNKKDLVKRIHDSSRERAFSLQHMLLLEDPFEREAETMRIYLNGSRIIDAREQILKLPLDSNEHAIVERYKELVSRGAAAQKNVLDLITNDELEQARHILINDVIPIQRDALAQLKLLEDYQDTSIRAALQQGENSYDRARLLLIILGGIAVALLVTIAIKVFKVMRHATEALHDEKDRLRITLHSIGDGVIATDSTGIIDYINPVAEQYTGWSMDEARGSHIFDVFHIINAEDKSPVASTLGELIDESQNNDLHHHSLLLRRDGVTLAVDYTTSAIHHNDGSVGGYVTVLRDESELREMAHHLSHQATHDPLTNLTNRREFERRLDLLLKHSSVANAEHVLCYLDLDRFKIVNDTCGHAAGDELLKQIVTLFRQRIRSNDLLARIGGDEFGLLLENCPVERALGITEEIRNSVRSYSFLWHGQSFQIGVSIGMVVIDNRWTTLPELLAAADAACYAAKDGGRNRVHLYLSGDSGAPNTSEVSWATRIQQALEHEHLIHYYQKPVPLRTALPEAYCIDLQLRIIEQGRQRLPFTPLVPQAERHGLAPRIDRWSVQHALMLAQLCEDTNAVYSVPLSAASLLDEYFSNEISDMAKKRSISPTQLCLEIPESHLQANVQQASAAVLILKENGFRVALNGTGRSLGMVDTFRSIPFDYLRISGDFIHEAMEDPLLHIQFEAIIRMAHSIGMRVIAMDIQSRSMIEQLSDLGVDYLSGHGIDKPQPAIALLITEHSEKRPESKRA